MYGDQEVPISLLAWVEQYGLSEAVLRKARELLLKFGYLEDCKPDAEESIQLKGRPKKLVQVSKDFLDKLKADFVNSQIWLGKQSKDHKQRIDQLLLWERDNDKLRRQNHKKTRKLDDTQRQHTFTAATRILLAILYLHADRHGVVKHLSLGDLSRLTGMSQDRLESQFIIIANLGYLMNRIAGLTNKALLGQVKSVFVVNVFNDNLLASKAKPMFLALLTTKNYYTEHSWACRICLWLDSNTRINTRKNPKTFPNVPIRNANEIASFISNSLELKGINADGMNSTDLLPKLLTGIQNLLEHKGLYFQRNNKGFERTVDFYLGWTSKELVFEWLSLFYPFTLETLFTGSFTTDFFKYLQLKIDEYACELVNDVFKQKNGNDEDYWYQRVEIHPSLLSKIGSDLFPTIKSDGVMNIETKKLALRLLVYCIAYQHALAIKALVEYVLPSTTDNYYTIAMLPKSDWFSTEFAYVQFISVYSTNRSDDESFIVKRYSIKQEQFINLDINELDDDVKKAIVFDFKKLVSRFGN
ncbi:MAG: hypothetical protein KDI39_04695 [Pseudomonadales bacterium]|nr:hypothetical protein [Pseudomonadales bacterium]